MDSIRICVEIHMYADTRLGICRWTCIRLCMSLTRGQVPLAQPMVSSSQRQATGWRDALRGKEKASLDGQRRFALTCIYAISAQDGVLSIQLENQTYGKVQGRCCFWNAHQLCTFPRAKDFSLVYSENEQNITMK